MIPIGKPMSKNPSGKSGLCALIAVTSLAFGGLASADPIHDAVRSDDAAAIRKLAEADAKALNAVEPASGLFPLAIAVGSGQVETTKLLLELGANPLQIQAQGFAPIHLAASGGRTELIGLLVDHQADLQAASSDGRTALQLAAAANY